MPAPAHRDALIERNHRSAAVLLKFVHARGFSYGSKRWKHGITPYNFL
jgi:hypothetical protein